MAIKRILVVDDSKSARLVLAKLLHNKDLQVDMAESATQAIEYLNQNKPDAIFMDQMMRDTDGLQAVKMIKDDPRIASIPIAMYTSHDSDDYMEMVKGHGAVGILLKPPSPAGLEEILAELNAAAAAIAGTTAAPQPGAAPADIKEMVRATVEETVQELIDRAIEQAIRQKLLPLLAQRLSETRDDMIAITQTNTELAIDNGIQMQVFPRLEEKSAELRKYVITSSRNTTESVVDHVINAQINPLIEEQLGELHKTLRAETDKSTLQITGKLLDTNIKRLYARLSEQIQGKISGLEQQLQKPRKIDPQSFNELQERASTTAAHKATVAARSTAEEAAADVAQQTLGDVDTMIKSANTRALILAVIAAAAGMVTAVAMKFL